VTIIRITGEFQPGFGVRASLNRRSVEIVSRAGGSVEMMATELSEALAAVQGGPLPGSHSCSISSRKNEVHIQGPFGGADSWAPAVRAEADLPFVVEVIAPVAREQSVAPAQPPPPGFAGR